MEDASSSSASSPEKQIGLRITSDPDRTEVEQPATHGARERKPLPFRILLVSDLAPQASAPDDWSIGTHVHRIDTNNVAAFMETMAPRLDIEVENLLDDGGNDLEITLQFSALDDFYPERIARQIPALAELLELRVLVRQVGEGTITPEAFRDRVQESIGIDADWAETMYQMLTGSDEPAEPSVPSSEEDDSLDRLLGMVDVEGEDKATAADDENKQTDRNGHAATNGDMRTSEALNALLEAVGGGGTSDPVDPSVVETLVDTMNRSITHQVRLVVEHPAVRRLESAWRGLKFLVDRINFRKNIQLEVLPAGRAALHEAMHHQVIVPEHSDDREEPPISLILVDMDFGREQRDIEQLTDHAETGESLQTPVVAAVGDDFFDVEKISGLARLPALRPHLQGPEYVAWKALRDEEAAHFLALALPGFLLRDPYGPNGPAKTLGVDESDGCWGSAALAVGVAAARSFADTGWPSHLLNYTVDDLPVRPGRGGHSPLAALLPGSKQSELARAGFVVLGGKSNHDAVRITQAPMVRRPDTYDDPAATAEARAHASLPCRLFVARAAHYLLTLQDDVEAGTPVDAVQQEVAAAMRAFLGLSGAPDDDERVHVEHVTNVDLPEHELLAVRMRPPSTALDQDVRLVMGIQVETESPSEENDA